MTNPAHPDMEPADWQEAHSPTEAVEVTFNASRRTVIEIARRRAADARLWGSMNEIEKIAAERIYRGFTLITGGSLPKVVDYDRVDCTRSADLSGPLLRMIEDYWDWAKTSQREKIMVYQVTDILVDGKSCNQVDAERRQRKGTARGNLFDGLAVYCRLKGW